MYYKIENEFNLAELKDTCGDIANDIQKAKRVTINYCIKSSNGTEVLYTDHYFFFIKVKGGWYLGELPMLSW